jgi:prepilin-type N-terminal cleavage/methylation domain-containing protein
MTRRIGDAAGYSLVEMMVAMAIMLMVMAGTFTAMSHAMTAEHHAKQVTGMNANLRAAMDLMVRDLLQVGQGLPVGRRIGVPNGLGTTPINRPGPAAQGGCAGATTFTAAVSLPAVSVGAGLGPPIDGQCTDVLTTLALDGSAEGLNVSSIAADGRSLTIHGDHDLTDDPDEDNDNIRAGDLIMLRKVSSTVLLQVTSIVVDGDGQHVNFAEGVDDPLNLNQVTAGVAGTILTHKEDGTRDEDTEQPHPGPDGIAGNADDPAGVILHGASDVSRVRMVTYYVDTTIDPGNPRLMRVINGAPANAVGFDIQMLRLTYDIVDLVNNTFTGLRMNAADLAAGGGCGATPCSVNQIRKANVALTMRSNMRRTSDSDFFRNTLFSQVSLRSLAFVDEYR